MIRRAATTVGLGELGFVLSWPMEILPNGSQKVMFIFERTIDGVVLKKEIDDVKFLDGSPDPLPIIE